MDAWRSRPDNKRRLWEANVQRHQEAVTAQVDAARRALPYAHSKAQLQALRLRVIHPTATVAALATLHDPPLTKDAYWSRLRLGLRSCPRNFEWA